MWWGARARHPRQGWRGALLPQCLPSPRLAGGARERGHCQAAIVCPFHGWSYNLDGKLQGCPSRSPSQARSRGAWAGAARDRDLDGLHLRPSCPAGSRAWPRCWPLIAEVAAYRLEEVKPLVPLSAEEMAVNWKAVRDVDNEGYHVPTAHPSLQASTAIAMSTTRISMAPRAPSRLSTRARAGAGASSSTRRSCRRTRACGEQPSRLALYRGVPQSRLLALSRPGQLLSGISHHHRPHDQRSAGYALPDERREMKLARYSPAASTASPRARIPSSSNGPGNRCSRAATPG